MAFRFRHMLLTLIFIMLSIFGIEAQQVTATIPSRYVNQAVWDQVKDHLIPKDHPIKGELDHIFSSSRAIFNQQSMVAAGFAAAEPQHHTKIIVTRHPALPGYVIKAYLDEQAYHEGQPEHYFWVKRVIGSHLVRESIQRHHYDHLFKVPRKWIYLLPDEPSPPPNYLRKMFILVEDDMELYPDKINEQLWGSSWVTRELLKALYTIVTELELFDCAKPVNCSFSKDGKAAFIDTQSYFRGYVKYEKLTPYLSPKMQRFWKDLIKHKGKIS